MGGCLEIALHETACDGASKSRGQQRVGLRALADVTQYVEAALTRKTEDPCNAEVEAESVADEPLQEKIVEAAGRAVREA
jgi:hypothetical protein